jgi:hypothetical protein
MAGCCTVKVPPPFPAICSHPVDLCALFGICFLGESASRLETGDNSSISVLEKRTGSRDLTSSVYVGGTLILLVFQAAPYPEASRIFLVPLAQGATRPLRLAIRMVAGWCTGPTLRTSTIAPNPRPDQNPPGLNDLEDDHPLDVSIAARFVDCAASGLLRDSFPALTSFPPVGGQWFNNYWTHPLHGLEQSPAVGGVGGAKPSVPSERFMEGFGSNNWVYPFLPIQSTLNNAKGKVMNLEAPVDINVIRRLAVQAVALDTVQAQDALLSQVQLV